MELQQIVSRYAEALAHVDSTNVRPGVNRRTKEPYLPGVQPLTEGVLVPLIDDAWEVLHPGERQAHRTEVRYPDKRVPGATKLDHVFTTDGQGGGDEEWGIEIKRLQFVGDNGGNGDHEVAKVLSPYLKDRGVLHDVLRLREYGFTRRVAVVGYGFDYTESSLDEAKAIHTGVREAETVRRIERLVKRSGPLTHRPLVEFADAILGIRGWVKGVRAEATFDAWRHPSGGNGVVFGWEVRRPELEPDYDPRHPW